MGAAVHCIWFGVAKRRHVIAWGANACVGIVKMIIQLSTVLTAQWMYASLSDARSGVARGHTCPGVCTPGYRMPALRGFGFAARLWWLCDVRSREATACYSLGCKPPGTCAMRPRPEARCDGVRWDRENDYPIVTGVYGSMDVRVAERRAVGGRAGACLSGVCTPGYRMPSLRDSGKRRYRDSKFTYHLSSHQRASCQVEVSG